MYCASNMYCRCSLILLMLLSRSVCDCFQITSATATISRSTTTTTTTTTTHRNTVDFDKRKAATRPVAAALRRKTRVHSSSTDCFEETNDDASSPTTSPVTEYTVTLHYENSSCDILARSDETILTALERNQPTLEGLGLPNSMIPSDCRRGNCLTCTGTHASVGSRLGTAVVCDGDGLSPHISRTIREKGYVLTCSTRVIGEGLQLNLGQNHRVWKDIYQDRLEEEPTQGEKWEAMAKAKRRSDERNQAQWKEAMGELLSSKEEGKDGGGE